LSWYIAARRPWRRVETEDPLTFANPETGEIREIRGGFSALVWARDEYADICGRVAEALGPGVLRRWEDGDESLDLAAEVAAVVGARNGYRRTLDEALNSGDGSYRP